MDFIPASVMNKRTGEQWLALMNGSLYAHQEKSTLQVRLTLRLRAWLFFLSGVVAAGARRRDGAVLQI
jgi:hypothetical protein